ncbi:ferric-dicitrate binding protein FerR (iron transport regulator) [Filimonas zeae]|uniref:Iron dicitrate transporter FecR n=1 Tax=Filimonas zeae TaxID=1737353 RepID=A0A917MUB3_9BACT|nr:FecR family protein [Filimonas zeae]MDR6339219.1 ferric-dicitrate binding protein FerR (iron transport regulator) [Filimonas zeae]GGH64569.1 iron dicitrate transporter FecR [Filimonas zeae]
MSVQEQSNRIIELARKWTTGTISNEEIAEFNAWYNDFDDTVLEEESEETVAELEARLYEATVAQEGISRRSIHRISLWKCISVAAAVIVLVIGAWMLRDRLSAENPDRNTGISQALPSGGNRAVLTLANGRQVLLDEALKGEVAVEGARVIKNADGLISYEITANDRKDSLAVHTVSTPRGGQFSVVLGDGSRVWMNAATTLRYPARFTGNKREVQLDGEAYFEISASSKAPFSVITPDQRVDVLGTGFNVKAYKDEPGTYTTLMEGAVKVSDQNKHNAVLRPGQFAVAGKDGSFNAGAPANVKAVLDWKNGEFVFPGEPLESVMRKIARWYDVEVEYSKNAEELKTELYYGSVSRWGDARDVLDVLSMTGTVKFSINQGTTRKKIIVMK